MQLTGVFVFPLCLGNTFWDCRSQMEACSQGCCTVPAGGEFQKQPSCFQRIKNSGKIPKTYNLAGVWRICCLSSLLHLTTNCGNLAWICSLTRNSIKRWIKNFEEVRVFILFPQMLLIGFFSLVRWMKITLPAVNSSLKLENTEAGLKKHWLTWAVLFFSLEALFKISFLDIRGDCKGEVFHAFKSIEILSVSYPNIPSSKTNALYFLSTELLRHPEIEKQPVPRLEMYCSGGISNEFELRSGRWELREVVGTMVWVHLINAGKKPIVHHHSNRCSAACRTRWLNIVAVVPNTSAALPCFFFFPVFSSSYLKEHGFVSLLVF